MTTIRARFDHTVTRWHAILQALPEHGTARVTAFMTAADQASMYVDVGLSPVEAHDELHRLASAHGLDDDDAVKWIIMRALDD
jgi:hypothetical protein